jgi:hypothetical protein
MKGHANLIITIYHWLPCWSDISYRKDERFQLKDIVLEKYIQVVKDSFFNKLARITEFVDKTSSFKHPPLYPSQSKKILEICIPRIKSHIKIQETIKKEEERREREKKLDSFGYEFRKALTREETS